MLRTMVETSARLLALLSLLQVRREWTGQELADRLEVGPRTIRRDVDKLRSLGYPVEAAPGVAGGYRLGAGGELPPLLLDDAEAVAVAVGLRTAASGSIAGIEETSVRALAKLEQVLPARLRRRVSALSDVTSAFSVERAADRRRNAGQGRRRLPGLRPLRFAYVAGDDRSSQRQAEPAAVVYSGHRWYLVAFDLDRDDWRTFRVDRIRGRVRLGGRGRRRRCPAATPPPTSRGSCNAGRRARRRRRARAGPRDGPGGPDPAARPEPLRDGRARRRRTPASSAPAAAGIRGSSCGWRAWTRRSRSSDPTSCATHLRRGATGWGAAVCTADRARRLARAR